jgi:hypothetical protein
MLAKDPAQRYPTPERAAQAVRAFLAAGTEASAAAEADGKMRSYLTWLEAESSKEHPSPVAPAKQGKGKRRAKKHKHRPVAVAVAAPPEAAGAFDVELVPAEPPAGKPPPAAGRGFRLSRRDFVMFGIGVLGTLSAIGCSWLLARLFGRKPADDKVTR